MYRYAHTAKLTPFTFELTVDATDYAATSNTDRNCLISPHMSINGVLKCGTATVESTFFLSEHDEKYI